MLVTRDDDAEQEAASRVQNDLARNQEELREKPNGRTGNKNNEYGLQRTTPEIADNLWEEVQSLTGTSTSSSTK
jgi:hypothetical protein